MTLEDWEHVVHMIDRWKYDLSASRGFLVKESLILTEKTIVQVIVWTDSTELEVAQDAFNA